MIEGTINSDWNPLTEFNTSEKVKILKYLSFRLVTCPQWLELLSFFRVLLLFGNVNIKQNQRIVNH